MRACAISVRRSRRVVTTAMLVMMALLAAATRASAQSVTVVSSSAVTFLNSGSTTTDFPSAFTPAQFTAAQTGPAAFVLSPIISPYVNPLPDGPGAVWIGTNASAGMNGGSPGDTALYAIGFSIPVPVSSATLHLYYAVDNALGDTNPGIYINGTALPGSTGIPCVSASCDMTFEQENTYTDASIGPLLVSGTNWLYIDAVNLGFEGGLIFSATIDYVPATVETRYFANLTAGDSYINMTNDGSSGGNVCVNVYAFDPAEELVACCACNLTPNALQSLSVKTDLLSNTLTPATPTSVTVKLLTTANPTGTAPAGTLAACNAAALDPLASGVEAWGSTIHATPQGTYRTTETEFAGTALSAAELSQITGVCGFIQSNASGYGICKSCQPGGLGATKQ